MTYESNPQTDETPQEHNPERIAPTYNADTNEAGWDSPQRARELVEQFVTDGAKILDIGIGTGQAVQGYSEKGATVIGFDHDQAMLDEARTVVGESADLRIADINKPLPIKDLAGQVDVVQAVGVLEFAENIENVFRQVRDVLKDGGVFVFTVESLPEKDGSGTVAEHYPEAGVTVYRHSTDEVNALLRENGFTLVNDEAYGGYDRGDSDGGKVPYHIFLVRK